LTQPLRAQQRPLAALLAALAVSPWFASCGKPLGAEERALAQAYLAGLGLGRCPVEGVAGWPEAARLTQDSGWSRELWTAESAAETGLRQDGVKRHGERRLLELLSEVTEAAAAIHDNALRALKHAAIVDATLAKVAAGAAAQACHQQALAVLASAPSEHAFAQKFRLFARGRWPLGLGAGRARGF
jgi:hypothetical protein